MLTTAPLPLPNSLRDHITNAYRMNETICIDHFLREATFSPDALTHITTVAKQLVIEMRENAKKQGNVNALLHQYDLSSNEGIALMSLAEALLRIPDKTTMDKFISDKLSTVTWRDHVSTDNSLFLNAATWSLALTGSVFSPLLDDQQKFMSTVKRAASKLGIVVIRPFILQMMKAVGNQFVMSEDIESAIKNAIELEKKGYRFSYDMLGEAARTLDDAKHYYTLYTEAIHAIGKAATQEDPAQNPGISVKLSALHPRYEYAQYERVMLELPQQLLALANLAKQYNIGMSIDAEEADRLDLSLDIFEKVYRDASLAGWNGLGIVIQAYQKRTFYLIDWLAELAKQQSKRMMVRLVKGAYWDAEIKQSQVQGFEDYPVFTRKSSTDVSYIACAKKLLAAPTYFYPQFGTHNAYSIAVILEMTGDRTDFEFQCLHGMGQPVYDQIVDPTKFNRPCRIYAPVGTHKDLLGYLVRRLLENGANSSFLNLLSDKKISIEKLIADPVAKTLALISKPHPKIPLPRDIYGEWQNSAGIDLSNRAILSTLKKQMDHADKKTWIAAPIVNGDVLTSRDMQAVYSPSDHTRVIGHITNATNEQIETALQVAESAMHTWANTSIDERTNILERAALLLQQEMPLLVTLLTREAGKCIVDCISEIRETIDYCRYYAYRAREDLAPVTLPGPTGEANQLSLHPRGVMVCISPWNFPIAIFAGQIIAALAAGNPVIAKPAEQTPLIAFKVVQLLHQAGIPKDALQLLPGLGSEVGAKLVSDPRTTGVMFTGSTETAKLIERTLANRSGPIGLLIAETGGQNAMIVDSSALAEQAVIDIAHSAFNSAGQRCSALRVLFVQEEIAPRLLSMLQGYMTELIIGDPSLLRTDIGPVIDQDALLMLKQHFARMHQEAKLLAQVPLREPLTGTYFAPCAFEISDLSLLKGEVFGPILHVIRYRASELDKVLESIIQTNYGLTLGIHSRIDATIQYIINRMPIGNAYVNRNMIGAVVGVQPFGGERLSGTGPKAGGPHYLPRLCVERSLSVNTTAVGGNARLVSLLEED